MGFAEQLETAPGVWRTSIKERSYKASITRNQFRWNERNDINDDLRIDNELSIVSDPFLIGNLDVIRYVGWMGSKWKVTSIQIQPPRVTLQIGGPYHEP